MGLPGMEWETSGLGPFQEFWGNVRICEGVTLKGEKAPEKKESLDPLCTSPALGLEGIFWH